MAIPWENCRGVGPRHSRRRLIPGRSRYHADRGDVFGALPVTSVVLPGARPMPFNVFRFLLIDVREAVASPALRMQQLAEFRLDCLRIPVFGSLEQESHEPGGKNGKSVPAKTFSVHQQPCQAVGHHDQECKWMPRKYAEVRQ